MRHFRAGNPRDFKHHSRALRGNSRPYLCYNQITYYWIILKWLTLSLMHIHELIQLDSEWKWHLLSSAAAAARLEAISMHYHAILMRLWGELLEVSLLTLQKSSPYTHPACRRIEAEQVVCVCMHYCLEVRSWDDGMCKHAPVLHPSALGRFLFSWQHK